MEKGISAGKLGDDSKTLPGGISHGKSASPVKADIKTEEQPWDHARGRTQAPERVSHHMCRAKFGGRDSGTS